MMVPMPIVGYESWRYHIAEKSPAVQPTRHRSVLMAARFHSMREAQKLGAIADEGGVVALGHDLVDPSLLHFSLRCRAKVSRWEAGTVAPPTAALREAGVLSELIDRGRKVVVRMASMFDTRG